MVNGDVDVVVVAYRSRDTIVACLDAVRTLEGVVEVVVVDHGEDGSGETAAALGTHTVADPSNPGFGAGVNRGLRIGSAPFVLLVNPDALIVANGVSTGRALLEADPDVAVVQGVIETPGGGLPDRSQGRELGSVHLWGRVLRLRRLLDLRMFRTLARRVPGVADHASRVPAEVTDVQALAATAWLVRRAAIEAVGGFDERYFLYGEDMDLCRRFRDAGWRLVALPDQWAVHCAGSSSASNWEREVQWWRGTMMYAARWWPAPALASGLLAATVRWLQLAMARPSGASRAFKAVVVAPVKMRWQR